MAEVKASTEACMLKSVRSGRIWSEAAWDAVLTLSSAIPAGSRVDTAVLTVNVTQDPIAGSYFTCAGEQLTTAKGTKTISVQTLVSPGCSSVTIPVCFSGAGQTYTSAQLVVSLELTVSYTMMASAMTVTSAELEAGGVQHFTISAADTAYSHVIGATLGGYTDFLPVAPGETGADWTFPDAWLDLMKTQEKAVVALTLYTYLGDTQLAYVGGYSFQLVCPQGDAYKPVLSALTLSPNGDTAVAGKYVKYKTGVSASFQVTASHSDITAYGINVGSYGGGYSGTALTLSTGALPLAGDVVVRFHATDARGRTTVQTQTITVHEYFPPQCLFFSAYRTNADGTPNGMGGYGAFQAAWGYASIGGANTFTAQLTVNGQTATLTGLSSSGMLLPGAQQAMSVLASYPVVLTLTDAYGAQAFTRELPNASYTMHFGPTGHSAAFGQAVAHDMAVEVAPEWELYYKGQTMGAQLSAKAELTPLWTGELSGAGNVTLAQGAEDFELLVVCNALGQSMALKSSGGSISARNLWFDTASALHVVDNIYSVGVAGTSFAVSASAQYVDNAYSQAAVAITAVYGLK